MNVKYVKKRTNDDNGWLAKSDVCSFSTLILVECYVWIISYDSCVL